MNYWIQNFIVKLCKSQKGTFIFALMYMAQSIDITIKKIKIFDKTCVYERVRTIKIIKLTSLLNHK